MENTKLIREIINYLQLSAMDSKEKGMWMILLPQMDEAQLQKLKAALEKEVNAITELYLEASVGKK